MMRVTISVLAVALMVIATTTVSAQHGHVEREVIWNKTEICFQYLEHFILDEHHHRDLHLKARALARNALTTLQALPEEETSVLSVEQEVKELQKIIDVILDITGRNDPHQDLLETMELAGWPLKGGKLQQYQFMMHALMEYINKELQAMKHELNGDNEKERMEIWVLPKLHDFYQQMMRATIDLESKNVLQWPPSALRAALKEYLAADSKEADELRDESETFTRGWCAKPDLELNEDRDVEPWLVGSDEL